MADFVRFSTAMAKYKNRAISVNMLYENLLDAGSNPAISTE